MAVIPVTADTIGDLDEGAARLVIDSAIRAAVADIDDRGDDGQERKVVVTIHMKKLEPQRNLVGCHVEVACNLPKYRTAGTVSKLTRQDNQTTLNFSPFAAEDPGQKTIHDYIPDPDAPGGA